MVLTTKGFADIIASILMPDTSTFTNLGWYLKRIYLYDTPNDTKPMDKTDDSTTDSLGFLSMSALDTSATLGLVKYGTTVTGISGTLRQIMFYYTKAYSDNISSAETDEPTFRVKTPDFDLDVEGTKRIFVNIKIRRK